jgi:hypothetical protein
VSAILAHMRTRRGLVAAALVLVGAVVLAAYPYGRTSDAPAVRPQRSFELRGAFLRAGASFSADPLLESAQTPLVVIAPADGALAAHVLVGGRVVAVRRLALAGAGERALVRWHDGQAAVALLRRSARDVAVSVASLDDGGRLAELHARVPRQDRGAVAVGLAPWSGRTSDLFVLGWTPLGPPSVADRATGTRPSAQLQVLDGDTAFRRVELSVSLPLRAGDASEWDVQVARVSESRPDLVLVRRSGSAHPEVHVLSGESGFQQFVLHTQLDLPRAVARRAAFVPALEGGRPVLWAIDAGAGRASVRVFPLGSAPPRT